MFEIIIREIRTVRKLQQGDWTTVEKRPYRENELTDSIYWKDTAAGKTGELKPVFGYTPPREVEVEENHEVFKQRVEIMEFQEVIKAINGIV